MNYVKTLRKISIIDKALDNIIALSFVDDEYDDEYDNISDHLFDRRDALVKSIKDYIRCPDRTNKELRYRTYIRRKQIKLACRYLNIDYYRL